MRTVVSTAEVPTQGAPKKKHRTVIQQKSWTLLWLLLRCNSASGKVLHWSIKYIQLLFPWGCVLCTYLDLLSSSICSGLTEEQPQLAALAVKERYFMSATRQICPHGALYSYILLKPSSELSKHIRIYIINSNFSWILFVHSQTLYNWGQILLL